MQLALDKLPSHGDTPSLWQPTRNTSALDIEDMEETPYNNHPESPPSRFSLNLNGYHPETPDTQPTPALNIAKGSRPRLPPVLTKPDESDDHNIEVKRSPNLPSLRLPDSNLKNSYYHESDIFEDINIELVLPNGNSKTLNVKIGETVQQIKRQLDDNFGIPFSDTDLFLEGKRIQIKEKASQNNCVRIGEHVIVLEQFCENLQYDQLPLNIQYDLLQNTIIMNLLAYRIDMLDPLSLNDFPSIVDRKFASISVKVKNNSISSGLEYKSESFPHSNIMSSPETPQPIPITHTSPNIPGSVHRKFSTCAEGNYCMITVVTIPLELSLDVALSRSSSVSNGNHPKPNESDDALRISVPEMESGEPKRYKFCFIF
jgi:hypothetical protein